MQPPTPSPHALPIDLQDNHNKKHCPHNRSLRSKALLSPRLFCPLNLQITNHKASQCPALIQPRTDLPTSLRVAIKIVARDRNCRDHYTEDVEAPCEGRDHVVIPIFKAEAKQDKAGDHEGCAKPDYGETGFGLEDAVVAAHIDASGEVVHPVAGYETEQSCDDGGEVEQAFAPTLLADLVARWA